MRKLLAKRQKGFSGCVTKDSCHRDEYAMMVILRRLSSLHCNYRMTITVTTSFLSLVHFLLGTVKFPSKFKVSVSVTNKLDPADCRGDVTKKGKPHGILSTTKVTRVENIAQKPIAQLMTKVNRVENIAPKACSSF